MVIRFSEIIMNTRQCCFCKDPLDACMGGVVCTDFLKLLQGEPLEVVREVCGKCALVRDPQDLHQVEPAT